MPTFPYVPFTYVGTANEVTTSRLNASELGIRDAHFMPNVQVSHNTTNSVLNNTLTALACNTENWDQAGNAADTQHDNVTNNSRLTCRYAGIYIVTASNITWSANPVNAQLEFRKNGATNMGTEQVVGDWRFMSSSIHVQLAVNDYLECVVLQISGGTLTVASGFTFGWSRVG